jgi:ubiquinone/menaquinone biosynthesis C-methylase UbiE
MFGLNFYLKILQLLLAKKIIPQSVITKDYDSLSGGYDEYFSNYVSPYSGEMVQKLCVGQGSACLDLACGTGTITAELARYSGLNGKITAVDVSHGMLKKAKDKIKNEINTQFICGDIFEEIKTIKSESLDFVTCGWAIGYSNPVKLLKDIKRILKPEGKVGIIENRQDTLIPLRETGLKVMRRYCGHIRYLMTLPLRLPKCREHLSALYLKAGLKPLDIWEGEIAFSFQNGKDALN